MPGTPSAGERRVPDLAASKLHSARQIRRAFSPIAGLVLAGLLSSALPAAADILPPERRTAWNPGIPGGIPVRTTICATIDAATYGNGTVDATGGIQAAINACPVGQVVRLSAGDFLVNGEQPIKISKGIVLRGAGPSATKLRKTSTVANPLVLIGERWLTEAESIYLTANAPKGATSVQLATTVGLSVGQLVVLDELTDISYVTWGTNPAVAPGGVGRGWFTRYDRPIGQMLEIASISGNTVSFTTPLHIGFDTAHSAQITRYTIPYGAKYAGLEDLYVRGGQDDNVTVRFALYSWVKNVESDMSMGDSFALDSCLRCVLRDSYAHDTPNPYPGGAGYMLSLAKYTADSLVENNIFMNANKVMVMRASGGGNVIGYNYFDNGFIGNYLGWVETGMNASHLTCPHFELFEGNQAFNIDGDSTWGGATSITYFRNHATGKRRSYSDLDNRRAIGLMPGHYDYSFVGNVLGTAGQNPAPYGGFTYEDFFPWTWDPVAMWRIGYNPEDWAAPAEARVVNTTHRHGNFDYATSSVRWTSGFDTTLPASLYLTSKPAFFGSNPWPWVDPVGTTKLHTLPARARYDAGNPTTYSLLVGKAGTGGGTVTSAPGGIDCGAACSAGFTSGTTVTLAATAAAGSTFSGWGGACAGNGACAVTMSAAASVTATFTLDIVTPTTYTLTAARTGTGAGTVTSSPAGISCGATCSASYATNTLVSLAAAPAAGSAFTGWSGACSGTASCQVTMSAARSVTATFVASPVSYVLTVTPAGTGTGTVTSSPAALTCGTTCGASFAAGTAVTLTAAPAAGSTFSGWSGACSGTGACAVTMSAARAVTSTFTSAPVVITPPIAHWKLDEGSGLTTADASGLGSTGTLAGGTAWAVGRSLRGVSLDGVNDVVNVPHAARLDAFPLSVVAWFRTSTTTGLAGLVNKYTAGSFNGYQVFFENGRLCAWLLRDTSNYIYDGTGCTMGTSGYNDGAWHQVAFVADASGGRLYVDGVQKASQPWTGSPGPSTNVDRVMLGRYPAAVGGGFLAGRVDDVRIYDRPLGAAEVQQLYTAMPAGPLAHLKFDEGAGTAAADATGLGNKGTLVNGTLWTSGRSGQAVALDGVNDLVNVPAVPMLNAYPLTVSTWVKTTTGAGLHGLVNKYAAGSFSGYQVFFENGDLCAWLFRSSANFIHDGTGCTMRTSGVNDGAWHHVAFVADASGGKLYVDGALKASQPWTGPAGPATTGQRVMIGKYPGAAGGGNLAGSVDDLRIYDWAMTAAGVLQLFREMPPGP